MSGLGDLPSGSWLEGEAKIVGGGGGGGSSYVLLDCHDYTRKKWLICWLTKREKLVQLKVTETLFVCFLVCLTVVMFSYELVCQCVCQCGYVCVSVCVCLYVCVLCTTVLLDWSSHCYTTKSWQRMLEMFCLDISIVFIISCLTMSMF